MVLGGNGYPYFIILLTGLFTSAMAMAAEYVLVKRMIPLEVMVTHLTIHRVYAESTKKILQHSPVNRTECLVEVK